MPQDLQNETTQLSPMEEALFQQWAKKNNLQDLNDPRAHYDYRGFWKEHPDFSHQPGEHFTDKFKQHGHPTFSIESQYSKGPLDGGSWFANTQYFPQIPRSNMDALQQQMMQRAMQSQQDPNSQANMAAHPPMPGAPPPGIAAPGMNKPPMDMTTIQKLLAMLGLNSGGQMGAPAPMGGPGQSGPQAAGGITDAIQGLPGMQGLRKIVGQ